MSDIDKDKKRFSQNSNNDLGKTKGKTEGVLTVLGDPKKAILKLSGPLMVAMLMTSLQNLIDGMWVAGLGQNALAAIGFIIPISMLIAGVSSGLSNGAISIISGFIGANNKKEVDNAAIHILFLVVIFTIIIMVVVGLLIKPILLMIGTIFTIELGLQYVYVLLGGSIFSMFTTASYGILRAEGNVKKTAYAMILGSILNMILDPILIYELNIGIAGASLSTVISMAIVSLIIIYWFKKDTYVDLTLKNFKLSVAIIKKILTVGLPSGGEFLVMALLAGTINVILVVVSGTDVVAVYSAGWNIVVLAIVLFAPISISVITTVGASFGAEKYENFNIIQNYSAKLGIIIAVIISITTFILAPYIAGLFTYSPETAGLTGLITEFLRVMTLFYVFVPIGATATSIFQGVGKGFDSFMLTVIRELFLAVVFAYILAIPLGFGQQGVWWGIVIGNMLGNIIAFIWSKLYVKKIIAIKKEEQGLIKI
jgi:putative MATE family efflux protein